MLINPVTVRVSRRVIERSIEALGVQKQAYEARLNGRRLSVATRDDLTFEVAAIEVAIDALTSQLGKEG
jgi:hypothetical protein